MRLGAALGACVKLMVLGAWFCSIRLCAFWALCLLKCISPSVSPLGPSIYGVRFFNMYMVIINICSISISLGYKITGIV